MNKCEFNPLFFVGMPGKWLNMRKPRHAHDGYLAGFTFSNKGMSGYGKVRFFNKPESGNPIFALIRLSYRIESEEKWIPAFERVGKGC